MLRSQTSKFQGEHPFLVLGINGNALESYFKTLIKGTLEFWEILTDRLREMVS